MRWGQLQVWDYILTYSSLLCQGALVNEANPPKIHESPVQPSFEDGTSGEIVTVVGESVDLRCQVFSRGNLTVSYWILKYDIIQQYLQIPSRCTNVINIHLWE